MFYWGWRFFFQVGMRRREWSWYWVLWFFLKSWLSYGRWRRCRSRNRSRRLRAVLRECRSGWGWSVATSSCPWPCRSCRGCATETRPCSDSAAPAPTTQRPPQSALLQRHIHEHHFVKKEPSSKLWRDIVYGPIIKCLHHFIMLSCRDPVH